LVGVRHAWRWKILWRRIEVVRSDGIFLWIFDDEGCEEWRLDVCHVALTWIGGVWTGIDVAIGGWILDVLQVDGSD
jgi:hypothetical protein